MIRVIGRIDDVSANNAAKICERGRLLCWLVGCSHGLTLFFKAIFLRPFSGAEIFLVVDVVSLEMSMQVDDRIDDRASPLKGSLDLKVEIVAILGVD